MKLLSLAVEGFRSFLTSQHLDLSTLAPGLYLVSGANLLEPSLEGNAAGKSSLFEAFYWCLYGKTSRSLKASNIRSWSGGGPCAVTVAFDQATIHRTWNPNSLLLNHEPVDQGTLDTALGISPETLLHSVYFAQFSPFFLDLTPTARMEIYSAVLGLGLWEQKSDEAKEWAKEAGVAVKNAELAYARIEERLRTLQSLDYSASLADWQAQQEKRIQAAAREIGDIERDLARLSPELAEAGAALLGARQAAKLHAAELEEAQEAANRAAEARLTAERQGAAAQAKFTAAMEAAKRFAALKVGECPECGQAIPAGHTKSHTEHLRKAVKVAEAEVKAKMAEVKEATALTDRTLKALKHLRDLTPNSDTIKAKHASLEQRSADLNKRKYTLAHSLAALRHEANPFLAEVAKVKKQVEELKKEARTHQAELDELRTIQAQFEFWVKGFKEVRYQVMQESLIQLNAEANECLHSLGLEEWALEFIVEQETKSGTMRRGFLCEVMSPYTEDRVPWEAWSGGESQRLRLAAQLGVANLLTSRTGRQFDFEFWDEPTTAMSPGGIKDLLRTLQERAQTQGKRIFVADHRAFDFPFDGTLLIEKTEEGSMLKELEVA